MGLRLDEPDRMTLDQIEQRAIERRMRQCAGDKPRVAKSLGICLKSLYNKLRRFRVLGAAKNGKTTQKPKLF